jgi:hypothetical protein
MSGHVFIAHIHESAILEDMQNINTFAQECLRLSPVPLYMLVDLSGLREIKVSVGELRASLTFLTHAGLREVEVYGCDERIQLTVRFLAGLLGELCHVPIRVFDTETQALNFLRRADSSIVSEPSV